MINIKPLSGCLEEAAGRGRTEEPPFAGTGLLGTLRQKAGEGSEFREVHA